jgi:hypothetical protein
MTEKRREFIHFRVTPKEKQALEVMATYEGRSPSEMMRELLREGVNNRGLKAIGLIDLSDRSATAG